MTTQERAPADAADKPEASVTALMALHDEVFVKTAYRQLLGREADDHGLAAYLAQVRLGEDKGLLLARLADSDEGRQRPIRMQGLAELIKAYRPGGRPWPVRALRRLSMIFVRPANESLERTLRAIDNRLYRVEQALGQQSQELGALRDMTAQLSISVQALQGQGPNAAAPPASDRPGGGLSTALDQRQVPPQLDAFMRGLRRVMTLSKAAHKERGTHAAAR